MTEQECEVYFEVIRDDPNLIPLPPPENVQNIIDQRMKKLLVEAANLSSKVDS